LFHGIYEKIKIMDDSSKNMKDDIRSIAFHEVGHAYAHLLVKSSFDFVTIDSVLLNLYTSGHSSGYIFPIRKTCFDEPDLTSSLSPEAFHECL
jgi:hypothetical protein